MPAAQAVPSAEGPYDEVVSSDAGEPSAQRRRTWRKVAAMGAAAGLLFAGAAVASRAWGSASAPARLRADAAEQKMGLDVMGSALQAMATGQMIYDMAKDMDMTHVSNFVPYYSYTGNLVVSGSGTVATTGMGHQTLNFKLYGVDKACSGNPPKKANACGIHIHEGMSCEENALGHYWNKGNYTYDPWSDVTYTSDRHGKAVVTDVTVLTGLDAARVDGHTFIVHDSTGGRIACGIITPVQLSVPAFTPYPGYTGNLDIWGSMLVKGQGSSTHAAQELFWYLNGLSKKCLMGPKKETPNSCGVHIHAGFSCADAQGHYWDKEAINSDPWATVTYKGPWGSAKVTTGETMYDVLGRTMVVHDYDGSRAACGIIQPCTTSVPEMGRYGTYTGSLQVTGWVTIAVGGKGGLSAAQVMTYRLSGVDPACTEPVPAGAPANACGIHIHQNASCTSAGGHLYNPELKSDPWKSVTYQTVSGVAKASHVEVVTGITMYDIVGKAFVVHDSTGGRVGCGYIGIKKM